jgi:3-phenylpropionate/cinnamic acid dioxygenase small subunit
MASVIDTARPAAPSRAALREARFDIEEFLFEYAGVLERNEIERWPEFFTDDAFYIVAARDNAESNLPLGLIYADSKAMLQDRAYALRHTEMYAPRYIQLRFSNTRVTAIDGPLIRAETSYLLLETLVDEPSRIQQVGKSYDVFLRNGDSLLFKERRCVYDSVIINNCLVFPV